MQLTEIRLGNGNMKIGAVPTFSLPARLTCPGASPWCLNHCYALRVERLRPSCRVAYARNLLLTWETELFAPTMLRLLSEHQPCVRLHVSGDFYSPGYIQALTEICRERPHLRFWAYTRSWVVPQLRLALEQFMSLPNVTVFGSTDPTMPLPPEGWRTAFIQTDPRASGLPCREQHGASKSCLKCGYCFREREGHVVFKVH